MQIKCPYCGSAKVRRCGKHPRQQYQCTDKKHPNGTPRYFYGETSPARVLIFDIETLPMEVYAWRLGEENWNPDNIIKDWCILSYSYKWLFEPASGSNALTPKEAIARYDGRLVKEIWNLFEQADIIIAHNGDNFDIPRMNTRFLLHGLPPPAPYLSIDTRATAKKQFGFSSNKLAYLARFLGLPAKLPTDFDLWVRCAHGDQKAIDYMRKYNEQDIFTLEDVYVVLRPWIKHPNMGLYFSAPAGVPLCPHCGHDDLDWSYFHRTPARVYQACRCANCGAIGRDAKSFVTTSVSRTRV